MKPRLSGRNLMIPILLVSSICITVSVPAQPVISQGTRLTSPFAAVYEKVAPAVVLVEVQGTVHQAQNIPRGPWDFFFQNPDQQQQQQQERRQSGMGSGVIVNREGFILTNNHVVSQGDEVAEKIRVTLDDQEQFDAEVVGRDPKTDLAVIKLKLNGRTLPAGKVAELGDSATLKPGDYAIAIGNPLGLERTITVGVISALGRTGLNPEGTDLMYQDFIQTDAQINPGNSGGALCDINGKIIGINDMYAGQYAGIGFAIPSNLARRVMTELIEHGEFKRGFVGLQGSDIDYDKQEALGLDSRKGILVDDIVKDYPADKAGIKVGDIILSLDGRDILNYNDFRLRIAEHKPGETIKLVVLRAGKRLTIDLKLGDLDTYLASAGASADAGARSSDAGPVQGSVSWRGIQVVSLNSPQASEFDLEGIDKGVVIVDIDSGSSAADTSLRPGDVILEINDTEIANITDFNAVKARIEKAKSDRPILVYRVQKQPNGQIIKGFVAVKP